MTDKQIIIDGVDVSALHSDQIACMNRYEVARLFVKTIKLLVTKEQECGELKKEINVYETTIEKIRQEIQEDVTCESRECGCDSYEECIECLKNTILNIINEERNNDR